MSTNMLFFFFFVLIVINQIKAQPKCTLATTTTEDCYECEDETDAPACNTYSNRVLKSQGRNEGDCPHIKSGCFLCKSISTYRKKVICQEKYKSIRCRGRVDQPQLSAQNPFSAPDTAYYTQNDRSTFTDVNKRFTPSHRFLFIILLHPDAIRYVDVERFCSHGEYGHTSLLSDPDAYSVYQTRITTAAYRYVRYAGVFWVNANGIIYKWENDSGHFGPDEDDGPLIGTKWFPRIQFTRHDFAMGSWRNMLSDEDQNYQSMYSYPDVMNEQYQSAVMLYIAIIGVLFVCCIGVMGIGAFVFCIGIYLFSKEKKMQQTKQTDDMYHNVV